ncbi:Penicillin-binding protein 4* [Aquisphaera giovannonii]|uniref:Penicillin-binding protein 4 n=1 Tax=Aquisphaera giovannonii TaxID=406548 RepID=A0A5B9W565_9BACT|nr:serine hydrolase domain-containing protein [Aquisphaera giovannonii]QEH35752.1 Penicillin-binding protein 4* [Aquisphaera giovannonii]
MILLAACLLALPPVEALDAAIDAYLRGEVEQKRFSGVILIAKDGKPLVRRAYGYADWTKRTPATPETAFLLYSNTKQFTAAAILMLRDRGKLALTDPIGRHLPDCPPEWEPVTLHHLLSHTSGIEIDNLWSWVYNHYPSYREGPRLGPYERKPLLSKPGEKFQYSNGGYMLLAQVIARVSGEEFPRFLEEEIFGPLDMTHTGCDRDAVTPGRARGHDLSGASPSIQEQPTHGIVGAGDVYSTVDDLLKWDEALYGDKLLSPASREAMFSPQFKTARGGVGYGWFLRRGPDGEISHFQHGGGGTGFTSVLIRRPKDHAYIAVLGNLGYDTEFKLGDGCRERLDAWLAGEHGRRGGDAAPAR